VVEVVDQLVKVINSGGVLPILLFAVISLVKEWVVPGSRYRVLERQNEELRALVYRQLSTTDAAVSAAESVTRVVAERQHG
jgi:hypothetical protein